MQSLGFLYHTAEHKFGDLSLPKADMLMFFLSRKTGWVILKNRMGYPGMQGRDRRSEDDRQEMVRWNRCV